MRLVRSEYWVPDTESVHGGYTGHGESIADMERYLRPLIAELAASALGFGVVHGLTVTATAGAQGLTVSTGLALDGKGFPALLSEKGAVVVDPNAPKADKVKNVPLELVGTGGAQLSTAGRTGALVLTVTGREALDPTGGAESWTLVHAPWLRLVDPATFSDDGSTVPLALVTLDDSGAVAALEAGPRRDASTSVGSLTLRRTAVVSGQTPSVGARAGPSLHTRDDGGLDVVVPGSSAGAAVWVDGSTGDLLARGNLGIGIGSDPLAARLHVSGSMHSAGTDAGLSFMDRQVTGYVDVPTAGERWVWYADSGYARLWSGTDQLSVGEPGDGGGLDVPRRMRVRQGGDSSAGIWFFQNAVPGAAFVGMSDDAHVGLWGQGVGWGLAMDVGSGAVSTHGELSVGSGTRANLRVSGDATVGSGGNGVLTTRHVNGKLYDSDGPDELYLNWDTGKGVRVGGGVPAALRVSGDATVGSGGNGILTTRHVNGKLVGNDGPDDLYLNWATGKAVHVGGGATAALRVHGSAVVDGNLRASAGITLAANVAIQGEGRVLIAGGELLYLLNKNGVIISKSWGGNGNLLVEGGVGVRPLPSWSGGGVSTFDLFAGGGIYLGTDLEHPALSLDRDGGVSARIKQFVIDHPLDPENRSLTHACIEGPEAGVYYRGSGRLDDGRAEIELPEYFEALTHTEDRTVMLTAMCEHDEPVAVLAASPVRRGRFVVRAADGSNPRQRFHWEVKAVRADVDRLEVESVKRSRKLAAVGSSGRDDR
jgi:hypothetical protein